VSAHEHVELLVLEQAEQGVHLRLAHEPVERHEPYRIDASDLQVGRGRVVRLGRMMEQHDDPLAGRLVRAARSDQAQAIGREGARAVGDLAAADELSPRVAVEQQGREVPYRARARKDPQRDGGSLADLLVLVGEVPLDRRREARPVLRLAGLTDLGQRDQAARDDVVVRLARERREQRGHDAQAHLLPRRLQALRTVVVVPEEPSVARGIDRTGADVRAQLEVGFLVEVPPQVPRGVVGDSLVSARGR
jgi:hypothetical protein